MIRQFLKKIATTNFPKAVSKKKSLIHCLVSLLSVVSHTSTSTPTSTATFQQETTKESILPAATFCRCLKLKRAPSERKKIWREPRLEIEVTINDRN